MTLTIPQAPDNVVWSGTETFLDCKYVYVRFESHSVAQGAPLEIIDMMVELNALHNKGLRETGHGAYALLVNPWVAEQIKAYCNALMFGVTKGGSIMDEVRSRNWTPIRTADQSAIIR
ncbi:hypothetical protein SEA_BUTTERBALL_67 [Gordonia phage Butterball]|uniref:Uncharacterized protein n=3 Tax=Montyvirus TaxID=2733196 RepID=A0A2L1IWT4_9CAUD|nr:hypothetical protein HWC76_gp067 [Gordonia phage Jellybones]AVD99573.1 hypothetical protein SEA_BONEHAM_68 [Gordonia phage Boneham]QAY16705.1 hypothetical protein SEA_FELIXALEJANDRO_69 [Gordonia phage FelixAlejandro]QAY16992.1 hypothetical protein SEA_BUTTERBALL_67 [Gordonia phage Butterball]QGH76208.1 hypothetical protein SEA_JELLYBONES_66 [Gordonia phage Jellybones]